MELQTMENCEDEPDFIFKVIVVGDSATGKSSMLTRFVFDEFTQNSKSSVGSEIFSRTYIIEDKLISMQIWDTAGQERFKSVTKSYFKGAKGAMIVYDITNKESYDSVESWLQMVKENSDKDISIMLAGNKSDLQHKRVIIQDEGCRKAKDLSLLNFNS